MNIPLGNNMITYENEKQKNAILYFIQNTKNCYMMKLLKLVYLFDEAHFKEIGRQSTNFNYKAYPNGPVAIEIYGTNESEYIKYDDIKIIKQGTQYIFETDTKYDLSCFSKREKRLLSEIATKYNESTGIDLSSITHEPNSLWSNAYKKSIFTYIDFTELLNTEYLKYLHNNHNYMITNHA